MSTQKTDPAAPYIARLARVQELGERLIPKTARQELTWERITTSVKRSIRQSEQLQKCDPDSVAASVLYLIELGLEIGGPNAEGFLVPFYDKRQNRTVCTPMIGAQGKIKMARRTGQIEHIDVQVVYACEAAGTNGLWRVDHLKPELSTHVRHDGTGDPGPVVAAWAGIWVKDAKFPIVEVMYRADFEKIKADASRRTGGKLSPAYANWESEMWRRSTLNRGLKRAPKSRDLLDALSNEDAVDAGGVVVIQNRGGGAAGIAIDEPMGLPDYGATDDDIDARAAEAVGIEPEVVEAKPEPKPAPAKRKPAAEPAPAAADDDGAP